MREISTLIILISIFASLSSHSQNKFPNLRVIEGSDAYSVSGQRDNWAKLSYPYHSVILRTVDNQTGQIITVCGEYYSDDTVLLIKSGPMYFYGLYGDLLFIDKGTGNVRELILYDLNHQNFITSLQYEHYPKIQNDTIFYDYPLPQTKETYSRGLPCPDSIIKTRQYGWMEKRQFVLKTRETINTGIISCEVQE